MGNESQERESPMETKEVAVFKGNKKIARTTVGQFDEIAASNLSQMLGKALAQAKKNNPSESHPTLTDLVFDFAYMWEKCNAEGKESFERVLRGAYDDEIES